MKVKLFDEDHESDLEEAINSFLGDEIEVIDIKYSISVGMYAEEQIYCFSALVMYKEK